MKFLLSLLFVLTMTFSAYSMFDSVIGKYDLYFPDQASWHHHTVKIDSLEGNKVTGRLALDFGLGPEARKAMKWEKIHNIPFVGRYYPSKKEIRFSVSVYLPEKVHYAFQGHFIKVKSNRYITGSYYIHKIKQGGFLAVK